MQDFTSEIERVIHTLFEFEKTQSNNQLFEKEKTVFLQISLFKIPIVPRRKRKFLKLCHPRYESSPDICLFVPNRKSELEYKISTDENIDESIKYYSEFLEKHKISGINTVMPLKQLQSEYGVYELRRKLVQRFDLFLCKTSLLYNHRFLAALGQIFTKANKEPLGVSFPSSDIIFDPKFNERVKRAVSCTSFFIQPASDNYKIPIGTMGHSEAQLKENISIVLDQIVTENIIPGGFQNIRAIYLWPSQSKSIPLYVSLNAPADTTRPVIKFKRKGIKTVKGEISSLPSKSVIVRRGGDVIVKIKKKSDDCNVKDISDDESFSEEEVRNGISESMYYKKKTENESESDDDRIIEEREIRLLKRKAIEDKDQKLVTQNALLKRKISNKNISIGKEDIASTKNIDEEKKNYNKKFKSSSKKKVAKKVKSEIKKVTKGRKKMNTDNVKVVKLSKTAKISKINTITEGNKISPKAATNDFKNKKRGRK